MTVAATSIAAFRGVQITGAQRKVLAVFGAEDELRDEDIAARLGVGINSVTGRVGELLALGKLVASKEKGRTAAGNACRVVMLHSALTSSHAVVQSSPLTGNVSSSGSVRPPSAGLVSARSRTPFVCECRYGAHTVPEHCLAHWSQQIKALGQALITEGKSVADVRAVITRAISERAPAGLRDALNARRVN